MKINRIDMIIPVQVLHFLPRNIFRGFRENGRLLKVFLSIYLKKVYTFISMLHNMFLPVIA